MTAPATPTLTPMDALVDAMHPLYDHGRNLETTIIALTRVQDLIEAALAYDTPFSWSRKYQVLRDAANAYRAWTPTPATGSGDGDEAGGGEGE